MGFLAPSLRVGRKFHLLCVREGMLHAIFPFPSTLGVCRKKKKKKLGWLYGKNIYQYIIIILSYITHLYTILDLPWFVTTINLSVLFPLSLLPLFFPLISSMPLNSQISKQPLFLHSFIVILEFSSKLYCYHFNACGKWPNYIWNTNDQMHFKDEMT